MTASILQDTFETESLQQRQRLDAECVFADVSACWYGRTFPLSTSHDEKLILHCTNVEQDRHLTLTMQARKALRCPLNCLPDSGTEHGTCSVHAKRQHAFPANLPMTTRPMFLFQNHQRKMENKP